MVKNLDLPDDVRRYFSASGKVNQEIAKQHIDQISVWAGKAPCALVWDSYGCHKTEDVKEHAKNKQVHMVLVPKNATSKLQPLDFGVFGEVAQRRQAMLREEDLFQRTPLEARKRSIAL